MTDDLECLDNIRECLSIALANLYETRRWIIERKNDYYHRCIGFNKLISQVVNLHAQYDYEYLRVKEKGGLS